MNGKELKRHLKITLTGEGRELYAALEKSSGLSGKKLFEMMMLLFGKYLSVKTAGGYFFYRIGRSITKLRFSREQDELVNPFCFIAKKARKNPPNKNSS